MCVICKRLWVRPEMADVTGTVMSQAGSDALPEVGARRRKCARVVCECISHLRDQVISVKGIVCPK